MDPVESTTESFIVKIWLEESDQGTGGEKWRGHITHVPTGRRRYVEDIESISSFISERLKEIGVEPKLRARLCLWLSRIK